MNTYTGGCHCGAVRYEVDVPENLLVYECNCSICSKSGFLHLIVPAETYR
ncbi:MAG: GFA family protein [Gammaproteobacteria bacterium]